MVAVAIWERCRDRWYLKLFRVFLDVNEGSVQFFHPERMTYTFGGWGISSQVLFLIRTLYSSSTTSFQLGSYSACTRYQCGISLLFNNVESSTNICKLLPKEKVVSFQTFINLRSPYKSLSVHRFQSSNLLGASVSSFLSPSKWYKLSTIEFFSALIVDCRLNLFPFETNCHF